jgi:hypothetical protein
VVEDQHTEVAELTDVRASQWVEGSRCTKQYLISFVLTEPAGEHTEEEVYQNHPGLEGEGHLPRDS